MTDLQPPFLTYSATRAPFHDGIHEERASFGFDCRSCRESICCTALDSILEGERWFRALEPGKQSQLANAFGAKLRKDGLSGTPYARFPTGRQAFFCTAVCPRCYANYVLALDFYEMQPARYIGVLQGAAGLAPNNSSKPTPLRGAA